MANGPRRARWPWLAGALVLLLVGVTAWVFVSQRRQAAADADRAAQETAEAVVASWTGDDPTHSIAGAPFPDAAAAQTQYDVIVAGLAGARPAVELGAVTRTENTATAELTITWPFGPDGWTYDTTLDLAATGDGTEQGNWQAAWGPGVVHPELEPDDLLRATRVVADRAEVFGPGGRRS